ncbi:lasso RiPP family leader peptide-containing protein [Streptomyces spinoverrucosus]|nr:lasso RiPP family leader peptide-containing protein [Streptomyces spinoverrucosus]MBG0852145.1 lasso RiPP family leader peptide-containing protein [Streptomyces spinoverrucosus]
MSETLHIEPAEVYETPLLAEAGDYAELTQGIVGDYPDFFGGGFVLLG